VEFALVAPVVFMFMFGIFEFCRYGFIREMMENAVREGARYAIVSTNSTSANPTLDVQNIVVQRMLGTPNGSGGGTGGIWGQLGNPVVTVAKVNPATDQFLDGSVPAKVVSTAAQAPYTNAGFGYAVSVGNFVRMPTSFPIGATSIMMSEGN
jgi:Flp pilus assembly protein TadG